MQETQVEQDISSVDIDEGGDVEAPTDAPSGDKPASVPGRNMDLVMQIPVCVEVRLGSANMPVSRLMKLKRGSIIALDRKVGEPIDLVVNGRIIARGEVVLMEDGSSRFGISLTEIVKGGPAGKPSGDDDS